MSINTTLDNGRLHIASGAHYQGSVNSYNNCVTRFTKYIGISSEVMINGKAHCLNNKSYVKLLHSIGIKEANLSNLQEYRNLDELNIQPTTNRGAMRSHLSKAKTQALGLKLIQALHDGDVDNAKRLLSKGASTNQTFWIREYDGKIIFNAKIELPLREVEPFKATFYTPLLLAASKNLPVVNDLLAFGANSDLVGKRCIFSRSIENVKNNYDIEALNWNHFGTRTRLREGNYVNLAPIIGNPNIHNVAPGLHLDGVKKEETTFIDHTKGTETLKFDTFSGKVAFTKQTDLDTEKRWKHIGNVERVRIL